MRAVALALGFALGLGSPVWGQPGEFSPPDWEDPHAGHLVPPDDPHAGHAVLPDAAFADPAPPPDTRTPAPRPVRVDPHAGHTPRPRDTNTDSPARSDTDSAASHGDTHTGHGDPADPEATHATGGHAHHNMSLDERGMVMNANPSSLPRDCPEVAGELDLVVRAGREFAAQRPGWLYGYDQHVWKVPPCTRINVTLENRDAVRHQWMVHGLPRYLYPQGMFTLEVYGPGSRSASFIVPSASKTYLAHCDVPHHMEKGMKGQLVVGAGDGDLPSIPGVSAPLVADRYGAALAATSSTLLLLGVAVGLGAAVSVALRRA